MLRIAATEYARMVAHCYDGLPLEACGLLGGPAGSDDVHAVLPATNVDGSSRTFSLGPDAWQQVDDVLTPRNLDVVGIFHSHTHTDAYPSPTDVDQASNPFLAGYRWVIVSLRDEAPMTRSYRIVDGKIVEEPVVVVDA